MPHYSSRKSQPTCTLSLAHVSAQPSTMQVELHLDFSSVITLPVPSRRRTKSKRLVPQTINVIPFPSSDPPHVLLRSTSTRARKGAVSRPAKPSLDKKDTFDPPPYSSPPPPYSASPELPAPPKPSRIPTPTPQPQPLPQPHIRRPRASPSEIKTLLYLYRTIMYGVERRHRLETTRHTRPSSPSSGQSTPGTSPGKSSGNHFARFPLVEDDGDDDDQPVFAGRRTSSKAPAQTANFDVQDALLAIRLRVFLKSQGVSESELAVHFSSSDSDSVSVSDEEDDIVLVSDTREPVLISPTPVIAPPRPIRSSPPPLSPVPSNNPATSTAYMIAHLKMRRQIPGRKIFGVVNDSVSGSGSGKGRGRGRVMSGLRACAWVGAGEGADADEVKEEEDEEFDVGWYSEMGY